MVDLHTQNMYLCSTILGKKIRRMNEHTPYLSSALLVFIISVATLSQIQNKSTTSMPIICALSVK